VSGRPLQPIEDKQAIFIREGAEQLVGGRHRVQPKWHLCT
jgi:hypothetical protein